MVGQFHLIITNRMSDPVQCHIPFMRTEVKLKLIFPVYACSRFLVCYAQIRSIYLEMCSPEHLSCRNTFAQETNFNIAQQTLLVL